MVLGSPGGPRITTTVLNIFLSVAEGGLNIQQAVDAPRFHHQYLPDTLYLEAGFPADTAAKLATEGYTLKQGGHWSDGECIAVDPEDRETGRRPGPPPALSAKPPGTDRPCRQAGAAARFRPQ